MSLDYAAIAQTAAAAIRDAGQPLLIRRPSAPGTYDPVTGTTVGAGAPVDYPVYGVVLPSLSGWGSVRNPELIQTGDEFALVEATATEPLRTDRLIVGGRTMQIVDIERLAPAGTAVLYTLHLRP